MERKRTFLRDSSGGETDFVSDRENGYRPTASSWRAAAP
jgi:hypothetical protein